MATPRMKWVALLVVSGALVACEGAEGPKGVGNKSIETLSGSNVVRQHDPQKVSVGAKVYQRHCAVCHGEEGQGAPNWRQKDASGYYPPPPLNGGGHEWHHSIEDLRAIISRGSPPGKGKMPAWGGKLSEAEIDAVIDWFQSQWPDAVYAAWVDMTQPSAR